MKKIKTKNGPTIKVDDSDYAFLSRFPWVISRDKTGRINGAYTQVNMGRLLLHPRRGLEVDHINRNPLDNRRSNLRAVTRSTNTKNRTRHGLPRISHTSKYHGVFCCHKSKYTYWIASYKNKGEQRMRHFAYNPHGEIEAALWYDMHALELYGEKAITNFLVCR